MGLKRGHGAVVPPFIKYEAQEDGARSELDDTVIAEPANLQRGNDLRSTHFAKTLSTRFKPLSEPHEADIRRNER
jgi:hypothetical protein